MNRKRVDSRKSKNFKKSLGRIIKYSRKYINLIIFSLLLISISAIITVIGPNFLKNLTKAITDIITNPIDKDIHFNTIKNIAITLIILYITASVLDIIQGIVLVNVTEKISFDLREDLSKKMNVLPLKYYDTNNKGDYISKITNDVQTVGQTLTEGLNSFLSSIILVVGSSIMMFITNWILALTAIVSSLLGFIFVAIILKSSQKYFKNQQQQIGTLSGFLEETYSNHEIINVYNAKRLTKNKFDENNKLLKTSAWKSQFFSGLMMPLMGFVSNLGYVMISVVGALLVKNNIIGVEVIAVFLIYIRLFTQPLSRLTQVFSSFQRTAAASERIFEVLDEVELEDESKKTLMLEDLRGDVMFDNINFSYVEDTEVIKGFTAKVKSGEKIAIVGPTGAGKTTIVNLLMRFYEISEGSIFIDNINIADVTRGNLHDQFSMVLQDTWIFNGTIFDNIKYTVDASLDEVIKVCKSIGLDHFIKTLPEGYNTVLSSDKSLSQGQRQLITIARAMIKNSPLLILDEATSSVDTRTEVLIQRAMDKLMENRTSFIIAHRLSTIKNADLILVMNEGTIIEQGTHNELIELDKFYANLYNSQFEV